MARALLLVAALVALLLVCTVSAYPVSESDGLVTPLFLELDESLDLPDSEVDAASDAILQALDDGREHDAVALIEAAAQADSEMEVSAEAEAQTENQVEAEAVTADAGEGEAEAEAATEGAEGATAEAGGEAEAGAEAAAGAEATAEAGAEAGAEGEAAAEAHVQDGSDVAAALAESEAAEEAAAEKAQAESGKAAQTATPTNPTYVLPYPPIVPGHYTPMFNPYTNVNPLSTPFAKHAVDPAAHPAVAATAAAHAGHLAAINAHVAGGGDGKGALPPHAAGGYPYVPFTARHPVIAEQLQGNPVPFSGYAGWMHPQNFNSAAVGENQNAASLGQFLELDVEIDHGECVGCSY